MSFSYESRVDTMGRCKLTQPLTPPNCESSPRDIPLHGAVRMRRVWLLAMQPMARCVSTVELRPGAAVRSPLKFNPS